MSDALRKHARRHHGVGLDPLDLASIAGIITDSQHGTKTGIPDAHHRKWSWADEQGWHRSIFLPLAYRKSWVDKGVVLAVGGAGEWDETRCTLPCVVLKSKDDWYLYYSGRDAAGVWGVGLARSSDGISFTKYAGNPIISGKTNLQVIYDDYETDPAKKWKGTVSENLGLYYSSDGVSWSYQKDLITLLTAYKQSAVWFRLGNAYFIMYEDTASPSNIRLSVFNPDLTEAYNYGPIISTGGTGEWDEIRVTEIGMFWNLGVWYLIYMGQDANNVYRIGMALTVGNPFRTWDKWALNPVVQRETVSWRGVTQGNIIMLEDEFRLYCATTGDTPGFTDIRRYELI